jgi:hypothetical protein
MQKTQFTPLKIALTTMGIQQKRSPVRRFKEHRDGIDRKIAPGQIRLEAGPFHLRLPGRHGVMLRSGCGHIQKNHHPGHLKLQLHGAVGTMNPLASPSHAGHMAKAFHEALG